MMDRLAPLLVLLAVLTVAALLAWAGYWITLAVWAIWTVIGAAGWAAIVKWGRDEHSV